MDTVGYLICTYRCSSTYPLSSIVYKLLLNAPKIKTVTYGQRAFSYVAATLWNSIPDNIRNSKTAEIVTAEIFKTGLKSFLFEEAYNSFN